MFNNRYFIFENLIKLFIIAYLIIEYASKGSLQTYLSSHKDNKEYDLDLILKWAKDIALGMNYLHEEAIVKIIHRDLKSTNGLLKLSWIFSTIYLFYLKLSFHMIMFAKYVTLAQAFLAIKPLRCLLLGNKLACLSV